MTRELAGELQADNDELRETNRQLIAAMEEIQTLNVTLQSVNEALHATNVELRSALDQLPDERAPDAVADHHEAPDAQVIHEGEVVVGIGVPRPIELERPGRLAARRVAWPFYARFSGAAPRAAEHVGARKRLFLGDRHAVVDTSVLDAAERRGRAARHARRHAVAS